MELSTAELELIESGLCEFALMRPEGEGAQLLARVRAELAARDSAQTEMDIAEKPRHTAASFIELADTHARAITTSGLFTESFVQAFTIAKHMVNGGSYSNGESQIVFTQLDKLQRHFA